jgi:bifunctional non-homologous end joining protein LigD
MPIFVIHEHNAKKLHWDFRLELGGKLKSWVLPKTPPAYKSIKRLAIQEKDHEKEYANFQGEILEGYGKGRVKIWDKGTFTLIKRTPNEIEFILQGKQVRGKYVLIKAKLNENENNWLLMKI